MCIFTFRCARTRQAKCIKQNLKCVRRSGAAVKVKKLFNSSTSSTQHRTQSSKVFRAHIKRHISTKYLKKKSLFASITKKSKLKFENEQIYSLVTQVWNPQNEDFHPFYTSTCSLDCSEALILTFKNNFFNNTHSVAFCACARTSLQTRTHTPVFFIRVLTQTPHFYTQFTTSERIRRATFV